MQILLCHKAYKWVYCPCGVRSSGGRPCRAGAPTESGDENAHDCAVEVVS